MKFRAKNIVPPNGSHQTVSKVAAGALSINIFFAGQGQIMANLYPNVLSPYNDPANTASTPEYHSVIYIDETGSSKYVLLMPMRIEVRQVDEHDFVAAFPAAEINASGETPDESVHMLQDMIIGRLEHLSTIDVKLLGRKPKRQLSVLRSYIREC